MKSLMERAEENLEAITGRNGDAPEQKNQGMPWPVMAPEAFHGTAGDFVRLIEPHSEADPVAVLVQFLVSAGNVIGPSPYFKVEADRHRVNLYTVMVGETAKGRKGTSEGRQREVFREVDPEWASERIQSGLSSGEGLIWAVRDPISKTEPIREKKNITGYQDVIVDQGVSDKRLLVIESEFASTLRVMGRDGNTLSAVIRQAWDSGHLRVMTKNTPAKASGAHVSIIGHITKDELLRYMDRTEIGNGFANRVLWSCVRRSKCLPEGGTLQEEALRPIIQSLDKAIRFARTVTEITREGEAWRIWCEVYPALSEGHPGLFGAVTSRAEAQVTRLSSLFALLDCSSVVGKVHLMAALAVWEYCEASCRYIFGDALGDPMADEILRAIKGNPAGLTRTEISDLFKRNRSAGQIQRALETLEKQGRIRKVSEETGGRPTEKWLWT